MEFLVVLGGMVWLLSVVLYMSAWVLAAVLAPLPAVALLARWAPGISIRALIATSLVEGWVLLAILYVATDGGIVVRGGTVVFDNGMRREIGELLFLGLWSLPVMSGTVWLSVRVLFRGRFHHG